MPAVFKTPNLACALCTSATSPLAASRTPGSGGGRLDRRKPGPHKVKTTTQPRAPVSSGSAMWPSPFTSLHPGFLMGKRRMVATSEGCDGGSTGPPLRPKFKHLLYFLYKIQSGLEKSFLATQSKGGNLVPSSGHMGGSPHPPPQASTVLPEGRQQCPPHPLAAQLMSPKPARPHLETKKKKKIKMASDTQPSETGRKSSETQTLSWPQVSGGMSDAVKSR